VKRWALRISVLLLLGAMVNVALAWGCTWNARLSSVARMELPSEDDRRAWIVWRESHYGEGAAFASHSRSRGFEVSQVTSARKPNSYALICENGKPKGTKESYWPSTVFGDVIRLHAAGWPCVSLVGVRREARVQPGRQADGSTITRFDSGWILDSFWIDAPPIPDHTNFVGAIPISRTIDGLLIHSALPLLPLWPGFAINTLLYAAILWLLLAAPFALLRRGRIKRGLCPACAYPVGDSEVCTECGKPVGCRVRTPSSM
jgi:hypothetical protein